MLVLVRSVARAGGSSSLTRHGLRSLPQSALTRSLARQPLRFVHLSFSLRDVTAEKTQKPQAENGPTPSETLKAEAPALHRLLVELSEAEYQAEASIGLVATVLQNKETVEAYQRFLDAQSKVDPSSVLRHFERLGAQNPASSEALVTYVMALAASQREGKLRALIQRAFASGLGASSTAPMHVIMHQTRFGALMMLITVLGTVLIVGALYMSLRGSGSGQGGALSGMLSGKSYAPVDTTGNVTFSDVKGNYEAKEELTDLVAYLKHPERFANVKVPKGVLMVGPPGTGKTLMARALAGEAGVPFITASGSEFEEVFVGLGARRIRQLFEDARKQAPCIVFIDEIDAVGGSRDQSLSRSTNMTLNQLLVELDGFTSRDGVILIGATNMPSHLDPALVRPGRFDRKVYLGLPIQGERKEILEYYLSKHATDEDVDALTMARATAGFSGADLENMVNWAAIEAIKEDRERVDSELLDRALLNVAMGREKKSMVLSDKVRKITAYHEGGHALVALYSKGAPEIRTATLIPRGDALGMVNYVASEEHLTTREELLGQMRMAMGGRAAEELIFGSEQVTTGAASDFQGATRLAHAMVTRFGMSEKVGHLYAASGDDDGGRGSSKSSASVVDGKIVAEEVKALVEDAYASAKALLQEREPELHRLADALLTHETLDKDEIARVVKGHMLVEREQKEVRERAKRAERRRVREAREEEAKAAVERADPGSAAALAEQEAARAALHPRS